MDPIGILLSAAEIVFGLVAIYRLRRRALSVALGFGGSLIGMGLIVFGVAVALLPILTAIVLFVLAAISLIGFIYLARPKRGN